jgi:hypothetical protein
MILPVTHAVPSRWGSLAPEASETLAAPSLYKPMLAIERESFLYVK